MYFIVYHNYERKLFTNVFVSFAGVLVCPAAVDYFDLSVTIIYFIFRAYFMVGCIILMINLAPCRL